MAAPGGHSQCIFLAVPIRNSDGGGDLRSPHATSAAPTMPLPRPPGVARRGHREEVYGLPEQPCIDRDRFGGDATPALPADTPRADLECALTTRLRPVPEGRSEELPGSDEVEQNFPGG